MCAGEAMGTYTAIASCFVEALASMLTGVGNTLIDVHFAVCT